MINKIIELLEKANKSISNETYDSIDELVSLNYESPVKVLIAALCIKVYDPLCDTRYHQKSHGAKYCLRSIEQHTTNWCAQKNYFSTNCIGSLSNALRHKEPFDKSYSRAWKSTKCKSLFLDIFEQMNTIDCSEKYLVYILQVLKSIANKKDVLAQSVINPRVLDLYPLLCNLCNLGFNKSSIIPVLIVHSYYDSIKHPGLISLKAHNSPDIKGRSYGDIEIWSSVPEIVIEIKHGLQISEQYLQNFSRKVRNINTHNYILTSLNYQRYDYNKNYNVVCWNVASFVHYNLYNKQENIENYIHLLYKTLMSSSIEIQHKENLRNFFQN